VFQSLLNASKGGKEAIPGIIIFDELPRLYAKIFRQINFISGGMLGFPLYVSITLRDFSNHFKREKLFERF